MSLDTKYRPKVYADVIGQDNTIKILKNIVKSGSRYHQSYLFSGPWGSGKTTLARILARALLCQVPVEGQACDNCVSCKNMLSGTSPDFIEVDAATNSGKEDMKRVLEEIEYSTFSGNRKIYLFDEAHALTKGSLDSLLLPLENNLKASEDKKLVCIFCTTEPEKMRATILSRCAPMFVVQPSSIEDITNKLKFICDSENIVSDLEALSLISQYTDKHIRDALKVLERVSSTGSINITNVKENLNLDKTDIYYDIILSINSDIDSAILKLDYIYQYNSPNQIYSTLIDIFLYSYKVGLEGIKIPSYLDINKLKMINNLYGRKLLLFSKYLSEKIYTPTKTTLVCDLYGLYSLLKNPDSSNLVNPPIINNLSSNDNKEGNKSIANTQAGQKLAPNVPITTHTKVTTDGVYVNPRAINTNRTSVSPQSHATRETAEMGPNDFKWLLSLKLAELGINGNRKT